MKKLIPFLTTVLVATALLSSTALAASINNGGFESGLDGWTVVDKPGNSGSWITYNDTELPISENTGPAPTNGSAALSDKDGPMSSLMYQDVVLDPEASHLLSLSYWYDNQGGGWMIPTPLDFDASGDSNEAPRQLLRIDVTRPDADPFTAAPSDILKTILAPSGDDPIEVGWTALTADLSELAGHTVRLRMINTGNRDLLHFGVDDVSLTTAALPASVLSVTKVSPKSYTLKKGKQGVSVDYTLTRDAFVVVVVQKSAAGRRSGKKCAKPSKKNKKGKRCTRWLNLSSHSFAGTAGANTFKFDGKVHRKRVSAGNYRLTLTPNTTLTHGLTSTVSFKVKPAKEKKRK